MKTPFTAIAALLILLSLSPAQAHTYNVTIPFSMSAGVLYLDKTATLLTFYYAEPDGTVQTMSMISSKVLKYLEKTKEKTVKVQLEKTDAMTITKIGDITLQPGDITGFWTGALPFPARDGR